MKAELPRTCSSCGNEFSGAMEFCPVCMLRKGLAGGFESGESSASEDTVKPTTAEQALQRFEHYELVKPFVLVVGASGSGKSSLVRAGVLPLLTQPETIEGVGLWRWSVKLLNVRTW